MYHGNTPDADAAASFRIDLVEASRRLSGLTMRGSRGRDYHAVLASVHRLLEAAYAAEDAGIPLDELRELTVGARAMSGLASTILAHTQRWPRGYAGDFQLIERLLDAHLAPNTVESLLDRIVLNLPLCEQHRAKVAWQASVVRRRLRDADRVRVLSIACGGCRDLALLEPTELARLSVVLNDLDTDALALSRSRLDGQVRDLVWVPGNVLRRANRLRALGPFDVILVGGLLDYVPQRAARVLMATAIGMLAPRGVLAATNIATGNPWRLFLSLLADWNLIHRDEADMRDLFPSDDGACDLATDHTGLTWLASLTC